MNLSMYNLEATGHHVGAGFEALFTGVIYPPTKGGLEVWVFIFSFTFLDTALVTKTMCKQNLVPILLYAWRFTLIGGCMTGVLVATSDFSCIFYYAS